MGGSKKRDHATNIIVLCSWANSELEANPKFAEIARNAGWSLRSWQNPDEEPVRDHLGIWWTLNLDGTRTPRKAP